MAQSMNAQLTRAGRRLGVWLILAVAATSAAAENLPDPTRPSGAPLAENEATNASRGPVLQSVLNSSGRKLAIISGQSVGQGDRIGNARVATIRDAEVVLVEGKETQVLKLFPVVEKQRSGVNVAPKNGMRQ